MFWTILSFLRISSGLRLRTSSAPLFCHSDPERSEGEESPLFLEIPRGIEPARNDKKGGDPSASPQGDK